MKHDPHATWRHKPDPLPIPDKPSTGKKKKKKPIFKKSDNHLHNECRQIVKDIRYDVNFIDRQLFNREYIWLTTKEFFVNWSISSLKNIEKDCDRMTANIEELTNRLERRGL